MSVLVSSALLTRALAVRRRSRSGHGRTSPFAPLTPLSSFLLVSSSSRLCLFVNFSAAPTAVADAAGRLDRYPVFWRRGTAPSTSSTTACTATSTGRRYPPTGQLIAVDYDKSRAPALGKPSTRGTFLARSFLRVIRAGTVICQTGDHSSLYGYVQDFISFHFLPILGVFLSGLADALHTAQDRQTYSR